MKITTIGTGCAVPSLKRGGSCALVKAGGCAALVDLGLNGLRGLLRAGVSHREVDLIFLTHLHPDHVSELMPFLFAANYDENPRTRPLAIIGSAETSRYVEDLIRINGKWLESKGYRRVITPMATGDEMSFGELTVKAGAVRHESSSLAYRFFHGGRSAVITGDTGPCEELAEFSRGADLLLAEASLPENFPLDIHLSGTQAGELAGKAGVGKLVLTHFYPSSEADAPEKWARKTYGGEVHAASDGEEFLV